MNTVSEFAAALAPFAAVAALAAFALLFALAAFCTRRARPFPLRRIPAYERLRRLAVESVETGRPLHVTLGSGVWEAAAPELVAGLTAVDQLSSYGAQVGQGLCVTTGSPVALLLAMNLLGRRESVSAAEGPSAPVTFYGPAPMAYAGGAALEALRDERAGHLLLGPFAEEGLWLAEALQPSAVALVGGTAQPAGAALLGLSLQEAVVGEDLYAAGAYLGRHEHLASLQAQDWARLLVLLAIIVSVALATLGAGA